MNSMVLVSMSALSIALIFVIFLGPSALIPVAHADSVIATIPINKWPIDFAFNSANGNVYVSQASTNVMSVIDGSSHSVIKSTTYPIQYLYGAAYNPINKYVYVTDDTGPVGYVYVIDGTTYSLIKAIPVGDSPVQIVYNPNNGFMYVTNINSQSVSVIDCSTNTVIKNIPVGPQPTGIAYNSINHNIYVTNSGQYANSKTVSVIDSTLNSEIKKVPLSDYPYRIAFDSNNGYLYVALTATNSIAVIDGATDTVKKTLQMPIIPAYPGSPYPNSPGAPWSVAFNPFNNFVYVTYLNSEYVTGIDDTTDTVTKTIKVGSGPYAIGYNANNHNMYVANLASNTVSVIGTNKSITPTSQVICPEANVKHWDKIIFMIKSPELAQKVGLAANTELDIKVLDDPKKVADIKQKVLDFLGLRNVPRNIIQILDVDYSIICAATPRK